MRSCFLFILVLSMLVSGCGTATPDIASLAPNTRPHWVVSPERSGFVSVVGYAPKQAQGGIEAQQRIALTRARQELGRMVRVRVENTYVQVQQIENGKADRTVDSSTRLSSSAALNLMNAEVTAQWVEPANGDLYLLLELPE